MDIDKVEVRKDVPGGTMNDVTSDASKPAASKDDESKPQIQPCRYKTGKTLGAGSYSIVKECVHIDTGRYYAAKVINKRLIVGREHMVSNPLTFTLICEVSLHFASRCATRLQC
jgi:serine/threonine protein kinase